MHSITDLRSAYPYPESSLPAYPWMMQSQNDLKRVHIIGLGDVGMNAALGLRIAGEGYVSAIGLYDIDKNLCRRLEIEISQVLSPLGKAPCPPVVLLHEEELFACDIFLFCAAKSVPPVGDEALGDVRMAQLSSNRQILSRYAKAAADAGFSGLFGVVSDPLDLLCAEAAKYLHPEQVQGFGLGVMYARAAYYARKHASDTPPLAFFPEGGRVFGPHGEGLVAVNSIRPDQYDDEAARALTRDTVGANLSVRALGYKPYIAPGISSVALTLPEVIAGRWNDSARYLNGVFFGARNRLTPAGTVWECDPLPDPLFARLYESYHTLDKKVRNMDKNDMT